MHYYPFSKSWPRTLVLLLTVLSISTLFTQHSAWSQETASGILLADDQGKLLYSQNHKSQLIPASILKILTSLAVLEIMGPDRRIKTPYMYDPVSKTLYIKGKGDPLFLSETIEAMCRQIIDQTQCQSISRIILDQSYFDPDITIPGTGSSLNPYDATTGALCANFNTIAFKQNNKGGYVSAEPQTPLLNRFIPDISASGQKKGRILLSHQDRQLYPGLLLRYFFEQKNLRVTGPVALGTWPETQGVPSVFHSPFTISQVVEKLLQYSNNFMANQLLLILGAAKYGEPATLDKGLRVVKKFAKETLGIDSIVLAEGSGLSRQNRISPEQMLKVVTAFKPYVHLLRHEGNEFYKTGTLSDVRTRAGFIQGSKKMLYPFVIMLNHTRKGYSSIQRDLKQRVSLYSKQPDSSRRKLN